MELHTAGPWNSVESTEDYQGHFILGGDGRTVAATYTEDSCRVTTEDIANTALIRAAPIILKRLRQIARDANFRQEDGAMDLGQRLIDVERGAKAAIALYESHIADVSPSDEENADE
jgi:hypothetical protein